jgi:hypothetical protein
MTGGDGKTGVGFIVFPYSPDRSFHASHLALLIHFFLRNGFDLTLPGHLEDLPIRAVRAAAEMVEILELN